MSAIIIFAGGDQPGSSVTDDLPSADLVVAADGGYDVARALGFRVDVLVGDLDSIDAQDISGHVLVEEHPAEKDATDLELALELACRDRPSRIVVVGGSGGRLDHEIGVIQVLASSAGDVVDEMDWISDRGRGHIIRRRRMLHGDPGATLSLIPMGGDATGVSGAGLKWPLHDETLRWGATRGLSNRLVSPVADIGVRTGTLLALFPDPTDRAPGD